jgi:predicted transcriptional regulator
MVESLDLEIRRKLYRLLVKNPGLNLTTIAELLGTSVPLTVYHLQYLEKQDVIIATKEEGYKRFYIKDRIGAETKRMLSLLRQEIPLKIILFLLQHPYSTHKEILTCFDLAPSTLSYHLKKLINKCLIVESSDGFKQGFKVNNEQEIIGLLVRYKPSKVLERFKEGWVDFGVPQLKASSKQKKK